ncbi:cadherin domain-containing protein [Enterovibrio calviensis]|uniref:cadherin domain-containing protein n=1 Tax=Enterovibrio calviensis TaxID=91359 RepID=UPI0004854D31|nr:cadherin domain-containing protein [Enterovibrio calviensis]
MIAVSSDGALRVVNSNDSASVGDVVIAFHEASLLAAPDSNGYPGLGSKATVFIIEESGPKPFLVARSNDELDAILAQTAPNAGIASVIGLARSSSATNSNEGADGNESQHGDETRVPLSVIDGSFHRGMWLSDMAGFDTEGAAGQLSSVQLGLLTQVFPLSDLLDVDVSENLVSENAQIGDEVGITVAKEFADAHGDVVYTLLNDGGGLFAIDPATGVVTVAGNLDYETASQYTIEVAATSEDNQVKTQTFTINIADNLASDGDTDNALSGVGALDGNQGSLSESAVNGSSTGLFVSGVDEDGDTISYALVDDANGAFSIDSVTGEVFVADSSLLDYESATSQTIEVIATSVDGSTATQTFVIALTDDNTEFSISSVSDTNAAANVLSESSGIGASVGITLSASDDDGSDTISYALSDDAGGLFTVDPVTGEVTVASALDYETATQHTITVVATSTDGTTSSQSFTIDLTDDNSEFTATAITDTDTAANTVSESASVGDSVGVTFNSVDGDGTDSITYSLTNNAGGLFAVDPTTGEVTVAGALDYETATSHTITVLATSTDGSTSTQTLTINLGDDKSEFSVTSISDTDTSNSVISESVAVGSTVGLTLSATDSDGSDTVSYTLSDNAGGLFAIDPTTGVVTVASALDYETATQHNITVVATSTDGSTSNQTYTVTLSDDNSEFTATAITDTDTAANTVSESASVGDSVGVTFNSVDGDGTDSITFSLTDSAGGLFAIDANTGKLTVAGALDYETATEHSVTVQAMSTDGSFTTHTLTIALTDNNGEFALTGLTDTDTSASTISEHAAIDDVVGLTISASDADGSDTVSYSLSDDSGGLFKIDATTGVVTVAGALNYETATQHTITVVGTSTDGSTSNQSYTISLNDDKSEFTASAVTDTNAAADSVSESASVGDSVGVTFNSVDGDGSDTVTYSLTDSAGGLFAVNATTGEVTVAGALDYETATEHTITVLATSSDGSTSTETLTINLTDDTSEFSVSAISDVDAANSTISENASLGDTVGLTLSASDSDTSDTVSYSLTNDSGGLFTIDPNTGVVLVAGNLDYETAQQHTIVVQATSTDGSTSSQSYVIDVLNANATEGDSDSQLGVISDTDTNADRISDEAIIGATVGIDLLATDADGDNVVYTLTDDAGGLFTVDSSTGIVTVAADLSSLTGTTQTISVLATSSDGSTSTRDFDIDVIDGGVGAISDVDTMQNLVSDSSNEYTSIRAQATDGDGDTVTYSLSDSHGGAFSINSSTGQVYVANHSLLNASTDPQVTIEVTASSTDGSSVVQQFTIDVTSETDGSGIGGVTDTNGGDNTVNESAANGTYVGLTAYADAEGIGNWIDNTEVRWHGHGGSHVTGIHANGIPAGATVTFYLGGSAISTVSANGGTVYAHHSNYNQSISNGTNVWATVTYGGQTSNVSSGLHFQDSSYNYPISFSTNQDSVSYSLTDDYNGAFQINSSNGQVTVRDNTKLDFETDPNPTVTVRAVDSSGNVSLKTYGITLTDDYVALSDSYTATEENTLTVDASSGLLANDTGDTNASIEIAKDANGTSATTVTGETIFTTLLGGTVTVNADGSFTYQAPLLDHSAAETQQDSFYYRLGDGGWTLVTLDVTDQNTVANDDTDSVGELGLIYGNVISDSGGQDSASSDAKVTSVLYDGTTFFVNGPTTINAALGTLIISPDGSYSFQSSASGGGSFANELFTYTLGDDDGDTDTAVLTITHDASMTAVADVVSVYESGLAYGSEYGNELHYRVGNVLDNDTGVTGDATLDSVQWNGSTYTPDGDGLITIETDHGVFSMYTEDFGVHRSGEYQFLLTSATDGLNESEVFTYTLSNANESVTSTVTVSLIDDPIISFAGLDVDESFTGTSADETIYGGGGDDTLDGGLGNDLIVGGQGDDTMTGGAGTDIFKFLHADIEGQSGVTVDHITDFDLMADAIDLGDLLQDESETSLESYLSMVDDGSGNVLINVSSEGDGNVDQQIIFDNLSVADMATAYSVDTAGRTDGEVSNLLIESMLAQQHLYVS